MFSSVNAFSIVFVTACLCLLVFSVFRVRYYSDRAQLRWLLATIVLAGITGAMLSLPEAWLANTWLTQDFFIQAGLLATTGAFAILTLIDITRTRPVKHLPRSYTLILIIWLLVSAAAAVADKTPVTGWTRWLIITPGTAGLINLAGISVIGLTLLFISLYYYYRAMMPEIANRIAFRAVLTAVFLVGVTLMVSGSSVLVMPGTVILFMAIAGAVYGAYYYRVLDVRAAILRSVQIVLVVMFSWALMLVALYAFKSAAITLDFPGTLVVIVLALLLAVLLLPARQMIEVIFQRIEMRSRPALSAAIADYSRNIARTASLEEVVSVTTDTLNRAIRVRRSALILINNTFRVPDSVELIVMEAGSTSSRPAGSGYLAKSSPIYHTLATRKVPLTQFDLEYAPVFRRAGAEEQAFFRRLMMSAYVPIIAENAIIGLLACGPKLNDTLYSRQDMEMLMVIGLQVGTALRSARLIDDLQHLNNTTRALNKRLENAKSELEKLDSVKTDFITIASHELRTPLAQIRGYTDIIDSMNEQGMLKPGQTTQLVTNLRKATERMEDLISDMLDVSQIDVNALDLRSVRTAPETVVRLALDPLKEAIEERQLTVERSGLAGLPYIQADLQRMVQAFRNLILNAIKFTPDGGRIDISAQLESAAGGDEGDHILFVVKDTGVGIAQKDIELIFQKFYRGYDTQLHSTGIYKFMGAGPGLGLTIARGIIEGHGGRIWAESAGHDVKNFPGSVFYVRIPVNPPSGQRRVLPFDSSEAPAAARSTAEMRRVDASPATAPDESTQPNQVSK